MREIKRGFGLRFLCFPLREMSNWKWGRECPDQMFALGPFRVLLFAITIRR